VVEEGKVRDVLRPPYHPYTELLLRSVPMIGKRRDATGTPRSAEELSGPAVASGCKFAGRCPRKIGAVCETTQPPWLDVDWDHRIRCHLPLATLADAPPWLPVLAAAHAASHGASRAAANAANG